MSSPSTHTSSSSQVAPPTRDPAPLLRAYEEHHVALYRYCRALLRNDHDAQDALQEAVVKALAAWQRDPQVRDLKPWLYRIAHNAAMDVLRGRRSVEPMAELPEEPGEGLDDLVERRERLAHLDADLAALPPKQRAALVLRELNGLGHEEIADVLESSPRAVKQTIYEARVALGESEEGRGMSCEAIQRALSDGDGRVRRGRRVRGHLRSCTGCKRFAVALDHRPGELQALVPALPPVAAMTLIANALAGSGAAAGLGATALGGGGAATAGAGALAGSGATAATGGPLAVGGAAAGGGAGLAGTAGATGAAALAAKGAAALAVAAAAVGGGVAVEQHRGDDAGALPARSAPPATRTPTSPDTTTAPARTPAVTGGSPAARPATPATRAASAAARARAAARRKARRLAAAERRARRAARATGGAAAPASAGTTAPGAQRKGTPGTPARGPRTTTGGSTTRRPAQAPARGTGTTTSPGRTTRVPRKAAGTTQGRRPATSGTTSTTPRRTPAPERSGGRTTSTPATTSTSPDPSLETSSDELPK